MNYLLQILRFLSLTYFFFYKISHPRSSQTTYLIGYFFTTSPIEMQLSSEGKYMILYLLYFGFFILENNCFKRNNSLICPQKIIKNISIKYKFKIWIFFLNGLFIFAFEEIFIIIRGQINSFDSPKFLLFLCILNPNYHFTENCQNQWKWNILRSRYELDQIPVSVIIKWIQQLHRNWGMEQKRK